MEQTTKQSPKNPAVQFLEPVTLVDLPNGAIAYKASSHAHNLSGDSVENTIKDELAEVIATVDNRKKPINFTGRGSSKVGIVAIDMSAVEFVDEQLLSALIEAAKKLKPDATLHLLGLRDQPLGKIQEWKVGTLLNATKSGVNTWLAEQATHDRP